MISPAHGHDRAAYPAEATGVPRKAPGRTAAPAPADSSALRLWAHLTMFTRWIPVHRVTCRRSQAGPIEGVRLPAERALPVSVAAGHGPLAGITITLALVTMLAG